MFSRTYIVVVRKTAHLRDAVAKRLNSSALMSASATEKWKSVATGTNLQLPEVMMKRFLMIVTQKVRKCKLKSSFDI
jgi:hypothetical protein